MIKKVKSPMMITVTCVFMVLALVCSSAWGQNPKIKLIFASGTPIGMSLEKAWLTFEKAAQEKANGKLVIESYHGGQLYEEISAIDAVLNGTIHLGNASNQNFGRFTKTLTFMDLPYTFRDPQHLRKVMNGPVGDSIRESVEKDMGVKILAMPDNGGPRPIYNTKRVLKTPNDIKGMKIRVTGSPVEAALFKAWGASPVDMGSAETFTSLQTKLIDGHAFNWTWAYRLKHFDLLKYATEVNYLINASILVMRKDKFDGLPKDVQQILLEAGKEAEQFSVKADAAEVTEAKEGARRKGIQIYTPTKDEMGEWVKIAKTIYPQYVNPATIKLLEKIENVK